MNAAQKPAPAPTSAAPIKATVLRVYPNVYRCKPA